MPKQQDDTTYLLCVENRECDDLELRKVYRSLPDARADKDGYVRVVDESGEDYLYPAAYFVPVKLPRKAQAVLAAG
jgi:hypothetical protein